LGYKAAKVALFVDVTVDRYGALIFAFR